MKKILILGAAIAALMIGMTLPGVVGAANVAAECCPPCDDECPPPPCCECTRTPGFWKTHMAFTDHVFTAHCEGSIDLGWQTCDSIEDVMGMLWANKAKDCDGSKRDKLNKARVICSYQAVAAYLNNELSCGATLPLSWCTIKTILSGCNICDIQALYETLSAYNESGDECEIVCCPCAPAYNPATPQAAKSIAYIGIADP
jgi:hypothetical protein